VLPVNSVLSISKIVFITGGNKGLGYETARRLMEMGYSVYIGSRNKELWEIAARKLCAKLTVIDVTNKDLVKDAA